MPFRFPALRLCRHVRADRRRPRAPGRHRPRDRGRAATSRVYGDEVMFGGGKVIRDGMGQSQATHADGAARPGHHQRGHPRSLGHRQGRRRHPRRPHRARSARPATPTSWTASTRTRHRAAATEVIAGEGKILTAGGIDCHVHFICPQQIDEALDGGHHDDASAAAPARPRARKATTCTPGPWHIAPDARGRRRASRQLRLPRQGQRLAAGGARRAGRGRRLRRSSSTRTGARRRRRSTLPLRSPTSYDVQVAIHTDTLNEIGLRRGHASRRSPAARSTPTTPRAPAAATRPTSSRSRACRTCCPPRPTRRGRSRSTRSTSTSTC